jgi:DNA-binding MarR family transcriptional regulator
MSGRITRREYRALAEVRHRIRAFLAFSEHAARGAGIEPQQHQLLLAIAGLPEGERASVKAIAARLGIAHHSAVELAGRAAASGLLVRRAGVEDRRQVVLELSARGARALEALSRAHRGELAGAADDLIRALSTLNSAPPMSRAG